MSETRELTILKGPDRLELSSALLGPKHRNDSYPHPAPARSYNPKAVFEAGDNPEYPIVLQVTVMMIRAKDDWGRVFEIEGTAQYWSHAPMGHGGPTVGEPHAITITYDVGKKTGTLKVDHRT